MGLMGMERMGTAAGRHRTTHIIPEIFGNGTRITLDKNLDWDIIHGLKAGTCKRELETQTGSIHADWNCRLKWIQAEQN